MCCSCGAAMLNVPGISSPPPPPQGISGPLVPSASVGVDIVQAAGTPTAQEVTEMSDCNDGSKWLWPLLIGLAMGYVLFSRK